MTSITIEEARKLLEGAGRRGPKKAPQVAKAEIAPYPRVEQFGPLRHYDDEMKCLRKHTNGVVCRSPTYWKLYGSPTCEIHALRRMNEILAEPGQL